jgi:hypothetical protein
MPPASGHPACASSWTLDHVHVGLNRKAQLRAQYLHVFFAIKIANQVSKFPAEYRSLLGTLKVGAFELAGHWQEEGGGDAVERCWSFTKGDPNLSGEAFIVGGQALASKHEQTALVVSRQRVNTLETPEGEVLGTLTNAGAIEKRHAEDDEGAAEFKEGERLGTGYSGLNRMKDRVRNGTFVFDIAPTGTKRLREEGSRLFS